MSEMPGEEARREFSESNSNDDLSHIPRLVVTLPAGQQLLRLRTPTARIEPGSTGIEGSGRRVMMADAAVFVPWTRGFRVFCRRCPKVVLSACDDVGGVFRR